MALEYAISSKKMVDLGFSRPGKGRDRISSCRLHQEELRDIFNDDSIVVILLDKIIRNEDGGGSNFGLTILEKDKTASSPTANGNRRRINDGRLSDHYTLTITLEEDQYSDTSIIVLCESIKGNLRKVHKVMSAGQMDDYNGLCYYLGVNTNYPPYVLY